MARGLRIPVGVNRAGGAAMVEGDAHKRQVISTALSSGESANAFQQNVNLGDDMIFGVDTPRFRAAILRRLSAIFVEFERQRLFRLMKETIEWSRDEDEGELVLGFQYLDIESDEPKDFRKTFTLRA